MNEILIRYLSDVFNAISFISGICGFACFILLFVFVMMDYFVEHKLTWKEVLQDSAFRFLCILLFICVIIFILTPQNFRGYF